MKRENSSRQGHIYMQWLVAILANVTLFSHGLQCGWISSMSKVLQSNWSPTGIPLTNDEISWLASTPSLAAVLSVSVYAYLVDRCGRRICIISIAVMQAICCIITLCPATTTSLMVSRIFSGLGGGGGFNIVPMYVKEISQDNIRGTLGMLLIMCQNFGIFAMYVMGGYLDYYTVLWIIAALPVVNALLMVKAPESPTYLVKIGKVDDAASTVASLRGLHVDDKRVQNEIDSITSEDERFKSISNVSFVGIFKQKAWRNGFTYMIIVMIIHGMNGGFSIVTYASTILLRAGVTVSPQLQSLSVPVFMIIASLTSMMCVERLGRRLILAIAFIVSVVSFCALAAILMLQDAGVEVPGWLAVSCVVLAVGAYSGGVSPMPFVIMSEMFNFQIRAKVMGVLVTLGWFFCFVQLLAFGPVTDTFGPHVSFLCFGVINLCGACVVLIFLPETKGKSVEQIEMELEKKPIFFYRGEYDGK